ncbi:MAG: NAD(P)H-dependent oxidoreductase [Minisyncoccia bacterium]|jgi:NAD(P)H-dependent FMN reductase
MEKIPLKIYVIIGSTRQNRFSEKPARYLYEELKKKKDIQAELIDLRDWPLPFFDEPMGPSMLKGNYSHELAKKWAAKVGEADGYIIVTPEYNHGYPAVLKNALDWVYTEWNKKPVGFVSYGSVGGARSVEQLRQVVVELQMVPIRNAIHIPGDVYVAVMNEKVPVNPELFKPLRSGMGGDRVEMFFNELIAIAGMLKTLRTQA